MCITHRHYPHTMSITHYTMCITHTHTHVYVCLSVLSLSAQYSGIQCTEIECIEIQRNTTYRNTEGCSRNTGNIVHRNTVKHKAKKYSGQKYRVVHMSPTSYSREQAQSGPCRRAAQQARNSNHHLITLQKDKKTKRQEDKMTT